MPKCMTCGRKTPPLSLGTMVLMGFCSVDCLFAYPSAQEIFRALRREKELLFFFPTIPEKVLTQGRQMGQGGTNSVYRVTETPHLLIKDAGSGGRNDSREYRALREMEAIGLKTVARGLHRNEGTLMLVMDFISGGTDSKSIVGYQRTLSDYMKVTLNIPAPNPALTRFVTKKSIDRLLFCWAQMVRHKKSFGDFQFMLAPDGDVFLNDPTNVVDKEPNKTLQEIIQAFIDTWEYKTFQEYFDMTFTWQQFKGAKLALCDGIKKSFFKAFSQANKSKQLKYKAPAFKMLSQDFLAPTFFASTLYVVDGNPALEGFHCIPLGDGTYGYYSERWD